MRWMRTFGLNDIRNNRTKTKAEAARNWYGERQANHLTALQDWRGYGRNSRVKEQK
jgi:hypothetical protein